MLDWLGHLHTSVWLVEVGRGAWQRVRGMRLIKQDVVFECTDFSAPNIYCHTKVRAVFTNGTQHTLIVNTAEWDAGRDGVPAQDKSVPLSQPQRNKPHSTLNLEGADGWRANSWLPESSSEIEVPPNKTFRVWVGLKLDHQN